MPEAGVSADAMACPAFMNFEGCTLYGAMLSDSSSQLGFTGFAATSTAFCGGGALEVDVNLMPTDAQATHVGEINLQIAGPPLDLGGKTIVFHAMAVPPSGNMTGIYVTAVGSRGYAPTSAKVTPTRSDWASGSTSYEVGEIKVVDVFKISVEVLSNVPYMGKVYVDEIDIIDTPADGGADADSRPPDARDGGTDTPVDARDAPAGG